MPYCPKCGREVTDEMNVCPYCGNPLKAAQYSYAAPQPRPYAEAKNPGLGAVLSIIPGVGQMYAGRIVRGLLFLIFGIPVAALIAALLFWLIIPLLLPLAFWIWNILDAYNLCNEYNARLAQTGTPPW